MEYIQCLHCSKKYAVNDKIRAAAGRMITCKQCGDTFEIVLFETPTTSAPEIRGAAEKKQITPTESTAPNKTTVHKHHKQARNKPSFETKHKKKLSPSMFLGVAIVALSVYFFYHDRSVNIGQPFVATETPKPIINTSHNPVHEQEISVITAKAPVHQALSEACKAVAAQEWVMDYTMMHGIPDTNEYISTLDESLQNTAEIRKKCGGASIVQEVLASAKEGIPPTWLEKHVNALITLKKKTPHF